MHKNDSANKRTQHRSFWEKTCEALMQRLTAYALRLVNGRIYDAEELVQETVCRILTYPRNPEEIRSHLAYLKTIMRNIWKTWWLRERRASTVSLDELLSKGPQQKQHRGLELAVAPDALRIFENDELRAELHANQGPLTPREEELLQKYLEGYTCKEIAHILGEDARLIRVELNAVKTKVRSRLMKRRVRTRKS